MRAVKHFHMMTAVVVDGFPFLDSEAFGAKAACSLKSYRAT